jgi:hypothetical protein
MCNRYEDVDRIYEDVDRILVYKERFKNSAKTRRLGATRSGQHDQGYTMGVDIKKGI